MINIKEMKEIIKKIEYLKIGQKTTICIITTLKGSEIVGSDTCVNAKDYDFEKSKSNAYNDAINNLNVFEKYL